MTSKSGLEALFMDRKHPLLDPKESMPIEVLHLEDNDIDAAVFQAAVSQCSRKLIVRRVVTLADFESVLRDSPPPHLICADHMLPDGSAMDAIHNAANQLPEVPIIVITGAGEEEVAVEYLKAGAADYLSKRRLDLFPKTLNQVLANYRSKALHKWSEQERERLTRQLHALIRRVEEDRDEEKKSLSRDIHDQLGQELTALKLGLFWMDRQIRNVQDPELKSTILNKLEQMVNLNTSIIKQVRNIAHALRPIVLDQVGLSAGLESLVHDFNRRESAFCGLHIDVLPVLEQGLQTDIFRIVQEALTNISRHASANLAYIRLATRGEDLMLEIGDDGVGMENPGGLQSNQQLGLGMVGMRERARNHNGIFTVDSQAGKGTAMSILFPKMSSR